MSGLRDFGLDPVHVKLIELIAGMTAEGRHPEVDLGPAVGREVAHGQDLMIPDEPFCDGTDEAHPAWRRGRDRGVEETVAAVNRVLDELERGVVSTGQFEGASLEALKARLRQMMAHRLRRADGRRGSGLATWLERSGDTTGDPRAAPD